MPYNKCTFPKMGKKGNQMKRSSKTLTPKQRMNIRQKKLKEWGGGW